ncbi:unnamed protein product [Brassica oleracea]
MDSPAPSLYEPPWPPDLCVVHRDSPSSDWFLGLRLSSTQKPLSLSRLNLRNNSLKSLLSRLLRPCGSLN